LAQLGRKSVHKGLEVVGVIVAIVVIFTVIFAVVVVILWFIVGNEERLAAY